MSFDIHVMAFRNGQPCDANRSATREFLESIDYQLDPQFNAYSLTLPDGVTVEMFATGLHTETKPFRGAMIVLRGLSDSICEFIYNFCVASSCIAIPTMEPGCVLVPDEKMIHDLPDEFINDFPVVSVRSGADVHVVLDGGYNAWVAFRDRVLRRDQDGG